MKKIIWGVVMAMAVLAGCGGSETAESAQPAAAVTQSQGRLQKVLDAGVVRVAMIPDNPGWSVLGSDGEWVGYDADIARMFGEALGVEVEFISTDGASRIPMITSDKCDIVISGIVPLDERAKSVAFTEPYTGSGILGLCKKDNVMESWDDLADKKISLARGTTSDIFASETFPNAEIVRFDNIADAFMALQTDKVDVMLEADSQVYSLAKESDDLIPMDVDVAKASFACMAVAQGDQDWLNYVNNFIRNNMYDGDFKALYEKHFEREMPKLYNY